MSDIVPSWMWRDPEEIIEQLLARSARVEAPRAVIHGAVIVGKPRDRYYTRARRLHVKQLMRGRL